VFLKGQTNNNNFNLTPKIQEKYLSFCQLFVYKQVSRWAQEDLLSVLKSLLVKFGLAEPMNLTKIDDIFKEIQDSVNITNPAEFLLKVNDFDWNELTQQEISALKVLIADTMDILENPDLTQTYSGQLAMNIYEKSDFLYFFSNQFKFFSKFLKIDFL
jgi:hypothetical protein